MICFIKWVLGIIIIICSWCKGYWNKFLRQLFGISGRCFGALFGGMAYTEYPDNFQDVHRSFCIAATVIAIIYFLAYHFYMKPKCAAPVHLPPDPAPAIFQSKLCKLTGKKFCHIEIVVFFLKFFALRLCLQIVNNYAAYFRLNLIFNWRAYFWF